MEKHGGLWDFIGEISKVRGDIDIIRFFSEAHSLHKNFYENELSKEIIESMSEDVEKLIAKLREV